jgi:glyoxylase-like metal-dependent hydrolase (beta-lactamase superfamily II)
MKAGYPVACAVLLVSLLVAVRVSASEAESPIRVETVAPGVYAVISVDPLGLANHANAVFIVNDQDVIAVDTQFTLKRTRTVLAALRKITDKPVSVLINTHWHDDHTFGNQVYRDAFPDVQIISHVRTREDMATTGVENREQQVAGGPGAIAMFRDAIQKGTSLDGTPMSDGERAAYQSTIAIAEEYLGEMPAFSLTLPTKTIEGDTTFTRGARVIEIRYLGPGVTRGDVVVFLPKESVLVAGDLVDNPLPFAFGCDVSGWIDALVKIESLDPDVIVPGHGAVMRNDEQVVLLENALTSIQQQAQVALARGETFEQARAAVSVDEFRGAMAGGSKMKRYLFDNDFLGPVLKSAYSAALAE